MAGSTSVNMVTNLTVAIQKGTERTMFATWKWSREKDTESYSVIWRYATGNGLWFEGSRDTVTTKVSTYTAPSNATKVMVKVKPVAKTDKKNKKDVPRFTGSWAESSTFKLKAGQVIEAGTVSGLTVAIQYGTERTMFATWKWDQDHVDVYKVKWFYATGNGVWFIGTEEEVDRKQTTYSPPSNATKVKIQVKPISKTHVQNGVETAYWSADWSPEVIFVFKADSISDQGTVSNLRLGLQSGTDRTLYATWEWGQSNTESYSLLWSYDTGDGIWFERGEETTTLKQATYDAPSNAISVKLSVRPNSAKHSVNGVESAYWTSQWSDAVQYTFTDLPSVPSVPIVTIDKYNLLAEVNTYDDKTKQIEFQVVANNTTVFASGIADVIMNHAAYSFTITSGNEYKVRARGINGDDVSAWSEFSQSEGTMPATPTGITSCKALSRTSVEVCWGAVANADSYEVEYTTKEMYFDTSNDVRSMTVDSVVQRAIVTGLEEGTQWFFRVRASNKSGSSGWCSPVSVVLGRKPSPPTTWSQTTTGIVGENIILYWVHNTEDGSNQRGAQIEITVNGTPHTETFNTPSDEDEESDQTHSYVLSTSSYTEGAKIQWRVRTKGITEEYSDWSAQRTIDIYAPPTLSLGIYESCKWYWDPFNFEKDTIYTAYGEGVGFLEVLRSFPFYILATAGPKTQKPIEYYLTISSNETYETTDNVGQTVWVNKGEEVYSNHFDASGDHLFVALTAGDIDLENGVSYTVHCTVSMDSGLMAEAEARFRVEWDEVTYGPDASIGVDSDAIVTYIRPYCMDEADNLVKDVLLSVYRREVDGTFTEIATNIRNQTSAYITDPHPALDYARYRIVATFPGTGAIRFYDPPGVPVGIEGIVLQWDEKWSAFEGEEDQLVEPPWAGTMLRLPWNTDIDDNAEQDVSLINYIGRENPVSYYGTQKGFSSTWKSDIAADDENSLYLLRRLQRYAGDVYVRESSGMGYWANVTVQFSRTHCEVVIPVTLSIKRVEGGV